LHYLTHAESPEGGKRDKIHIQIKAYLNALVLTMCELRNFKLLVKNKATGTPLGMYYIQPSLSSGDSVVCRQYGILYICISVGLSALLVSTRRAMRRPTHRGTSIRLAPRSFFVYMQKNKN